MMQIMALRMKAAAMWPWRLQSWSSPRLRLFHPMVRATMPGFGSTTNLCLSQRRTTSTFHVPVLATTFVIFGPS
jgi:hypothetical protein